MTDGCIPMTERVDGILVTSAEEMSIRTESDKPMVAAVRKSGHLHPIRRSHD